MDSIISPAWLSEALAEADAGIDLIDVRTPAEFRAVHVRGARLVPLDRLDADEIQRTRPDRVSGPTVVICKSGQRAAKAVARLRDAGIDAAIVEGGTDACVQAGVPVERGQQSMSLERQVRIVAGALVFVGVLLGVFMNPWWLVLPGFVGAGLVFAGVTDTCGMGLLLARMPWNR